MQANSYAEKAYELSKKQDLEEYSLVLDSDFNNINDNYFIIKPVNDNLKLQWLKIYYPSKLESIPQEIKTSSFKISTYNISNQVVKYLELKLPMNIRDNKNYVPLLDGSIPIIIQSYYIAKGNGYSEQSLYNLYYRSIIGNGKEFSSKVIFNNLMFIKRIETKNSPRQVVNQEWDRFQKNSTITIPNKIEERIE